jgi:hypothetical protein
MAERIIQIMLTDGVAECDPSSIRVKPGDTIRTMSEVGDHEAELFDVNGNRKVPPNSPLFCAEPNWHGLKGQVSNEATVQTDYEGRWYEMRPTLTVNGQTISGRGRGACILVCAGG